MRKVNFLILLMSVFIVSCSKSDGVDPIDETPTPGTSREFTVDIVRNPTGDSRSQPASGGSFNCMYADGIYIDMDNDAVEYIVEFYDMTRSNEEGTTTHPPDATYKFLANAGNEILNGVQGDRNYINWHSSPRAGTVTKFTPQEKLFVMISWCTTTRCIDNCWVINGKAKVTVLY